MISKLTIKNVALIDNAELTFTEGLNVLSGETGAGKSVILDSVNFVLGAKADRSMIRYGETECFVKAEFTVEENSQVFKELEELDVEPDTAVIISRKYNTDGKGSIKINGNTVSLAMLKRVTSSLVDVHGQSEHFYLLKESNQMKVLDGLVGTVFVEEKERLSSLLSEYREIKKQLAVFSGDVRERNKRIDILKFQIDEIKSASLKDGEEEELKEKRERINHAEKIASNLREAAEYLSSEGGGLDCMKNAKRSLSALSRYSKDYSELSDRMENLLAEAEDIGDTLSDLLEDSFFDEREAEEIENRLDLIKSLKSKYGYDIGEINGYLKKSEEEYELLINCDEQFEKLEGQKNKLLEDIYRVCLSMTELRKETASKFSRQVIEELKTLNIPRASFSVAFASYSRADAERATENGLDEICFMFSANAGEPLKPLGKIISGGEMSRFMLSVKAQLSGMNGISTYIFDEIDTGISGKTAKVVAEKIAKIAKNTQVIAVSHLAQMAAMSDNQIYIEKREKSGKTLTRATNLDEEGKTREIVRLLGGDDASGAALRHAEELLENSKRYKNSL